jgi:hypothetical protein
MCNGKYLILLLKICEQLLRLDIFFDPRHFFRPSTFYPRPRPITLDPRPLVKLILGISAVKRTYTSDSHRVCIEAESGLTKPDQ